MPDQLDSHSSSVGGTTSSGGPSLTTSVYDTRLGPAALSWSRSLFGLSLRFILRLSSVNDLDEEKALAFRIRPWLLWRRRGSKRIQLNCNHHAHVSWDLTRACFGPGPEPVSGFFVSLLVNGELALVAGDMVDEAYRASLKSQKPICISGLKPSVLMSRREHMEMAESYATRVRVWGKEMDIFIRLVGKERGELGFYVGIDGKRVLQVKRLKWKFRGSEKVVIDRGNFGRGNDKVQISWDLHNWIFLTTRELPAGPGELDADAVFVFKFEKDWGFDQVENMSLGRLIGANWGGNWSESGGSSKGGRRRKGRKGSLKKTGSGSSSTSSNGSSGSGSTVMDWSSAEEAELRRAEGFSLLVYACKR